MKKLFAILAAAAVLVVSCGKDPQPVNPAPVDPVIPPVDTTVTPPVTPPADSTVKVPADIRVMYFNIRTSWNSEDVTLNCDWPRRKAGCVAMLNKYLPEVIGFNEMKPDQLSDVKAEMKTYTCFEGAYDDSDCNYIFYRTDAVEPVEGTCGKFWLSPTPDVQSLGWTDVDTHYRTCIYTKFKHIASGNEFWFFLTHPSNGTSYDVMLSGELIKSRMNSIVTDNTPVFIGGDMNAREDSPGMIFLRSYMAMARDVAPVTDRKGTYNDWGVRSNMIDHILAKGNVSVSKFATVDEKFECEAPYISDHYPVYADVTVGTDRPIAIPPLTITVPAEANVLPSDGRVSGKFSTLDAFAMTSADTYAGTAGMKIGTSASAGSFSFLPPSTGEITLSFCAFSWNKARARLEVSVSGGATVDGKTSVTILPRGCVSGSNICVGILPEDLYRFDLKGVTENTMITLKTSLAEESDITEPGATPESRVAVFGVNVSGGTPRSGSSSMPSPLNPRDDYSDLFK